MPADFDRMSRLLAMILVHDMQDAAQGDKALALSRAGLPNGEIAELLGTTAQVIGQQLYERRSGASKKKGGKGGRKPSRPRKRER